MNKVEKLIQELCPEGVFHVPLAEVTDLKRGSTITKTETVEGDVPVIAGGQKPAYWHNKSNREGETIVVAGSGAYAGFVSYWDRPIFVSDAFTVSPIKDTLITKYVYHFLLSKQTQLHGMKQGSGVPHVYPRDAEKLIIPVPPFRVQQEIVSILDKFRELEADLEAEFEVRELQLSHFRERLINEKGSVAEVTTLGNLVSLLSTTNKIPKEKYKDAGDVPIVDQSQKYIAGYSDDIQNGHDQLPCVVFGDHTRAIKYVDFPFLPGADGVKILVPSDKSRLNVRFLYHAMSCLKIPNLGYSRHWSVAKELVVRVPDMARQLQVVEILDRIEALSSDLTVGLPAEIQARRKQYEYYRNKLLTFKELDAA